VGCVLYSSRLIEELAVQFLRDLEASIPLDRDVFERRSLLLHLTENACRLFSPVL
jgi:hypothetical protein